MDPLDSYREYLRERDGEPDLLNRTLAAREEFFDGLAEQAVRSRREFSRAVFVRNLGRRRPEPGLSQRMLWLLATAKLNQAERFGVGLGETYGVNAGEGVPPEEVYVELEEHYHSRLLAHVLEMFDMPMHTVPPPFVSRQFVKLNVFAPQRLNNPIVGAAEVAGCILFESLRDRGLELFGDEPAVAERIQTLYDEILIDEIGHVGLCAARSGPAGRAFMRRAYPFFCRILATGTPETVAVIGKTELNARLAAPFDLVALVEAQGGRAFAAASV